MPHDRLRDKPTAETIEQDYVHYRNLWSKAHNHWRDLDLWYWREAGIWPETARSRPKVIPSKATNICPPTRKVL